LGEDPNESFVQVIEFTTSDLDRIRSADQQRRRATGQAPRGSRASAQSGLRSWRLIATSLAGYLAIVFFDSHEPDMQNSRLPQPQGRRGKDRGTPRGPQYFHDLDVLSDRA
jgi:hypothetical protein